MDLVLRARGGADGVRVNVDGEIDLYSAPWLRERLLEIVDTLGSAMVLDFRGIDFMDSSGLHLLLALRVRCERRGGSMRVVNMQPGPHKVVNLCGFDELIQVSPASDAWLARAVPSPANGSNGASAASRGEPAWDLTLVAPPVRNRTHSREAS